MSDPAQNGVIAQQSQANAASNLRGPQQQYYHHNQSKSTPTSAAFKPQTSLDPEPSNGNESEFQSQQQNIEGLSNINNTETNSQTSDQNLISNSKHQGHSRNSGGDMSGSYGAAHHQGLQSRQLNNIPQHHYTTNQHHYHNDRQQQQHYHQQHHHHHQNSINNNHINMSKGDNESNVNHVLLITVLNPHYPITCELIHQICSNYGKVNRIVIFKKNGVQAMVEFDNVESAKRAKSLLHGCDVYSGCCTLRIAFAKPTRLNVHRNIDSESFDYTNQNLGSEANYNEHHHHHHHHHHDVALQHGGHHQQPPPAHLANNTAAMHHHPKGGPRGAGSRRGMNNRDNLGSMNVSEDGSHSNHLQQQPFHHHQHHQKHHQASASVLHNSSAGGHQHHLYGSIIGQPGSESNFQEDYGASRAGAHHQTPTTTGSSATSTSASTTAQTAAGTSTLGQSQQLSEYTGIDPLATAPAHSAMFSRHDNHHSHHQSHHHRISGASGVPNVAESDDLSRNLNGPASQHHHTHQSHHHHHPQQFAPHNASLLAESSAGSFPQGSVMMVYGLNSHGFTCDRVFNLFCLYGNVVRVKFLRTKEGCAMVQMGDVIAVDRCVSSLNKITVFDNELQISYSKQAFLHDVIKPFLLRDGSPSFKDFMGNKNNRFKNPEVASKNRILPPSSVLHFFNAPYGIGEDELIDVFSETTGHDPVKLKIFTPKAENTKSYSGLVTFKSQTEAIQALVVCNHMSIPRAGAPHPYILRLCFSPPIHASRQHHNYQQHQAQLSALSQQSIAHNEPNTAAPVLSSSDITSPAGEAPQASSSNSDSAPATPVPVPSPTPAS